MIKSLKLQNFRGFEDHKLELRPLTILVGANNAGKSTIVEAIRLVSLVASRFRNLQYQYPPIHLERYVRDKVVNPSIKGMAIQFGHLFHRYGSPPATITAEFENGSEITLYLDGDEQCYASVSTGAEGRILGQAAAKKADIPNIEIMPQVGPVRIEEEILSVDYVIKSASSHLSSLHFRNQLVIFKEYFAKFSEAVAVTWPGVKIQELIRPGPTERQLLSLEIRNEDFVGEVGTMGHGLQMWIQTMWFLCRTSLSSTIILDEPDVYMHADLQRRLIRYVKGRFPQVVVATHSVEIMSEVDSDCILVVDRKQKSSQFATTTPVVQSLIMRIGSAHNLHLARLWNTRRLILVEGKDVKILKAVQNKLFPNTFSPLDAVPNMSLGGWGGWDYAIGSNMLMKNAIGQHIQTYCVFDRDYHTVETIQKRHLQASERGLHLIIWNRKEIENYFLLPTAIARLIARTAKGDSPDASTVDSELCRLAQEDEDLVFDAISTEILAENRAAGSSKANQKARSIIKAELELCGNIKRLVSGKRMISAIAGWSQKEFGVSISIGGIIHESLATEIPNEVVDLVRAMERGNSYCL